MDAQQQSLQRAMDAEANVAPCVCVCLCVCACVCVCVCLSVYAVLQPACMHGAINIDCRGTIYVA